MSKSRDGKSKRILSAEGKRIQERRRREAKKTPQTIFTFVSRKFRHNSEVRGVVRLEERRERRTRRRWQLIFASRSSEKEA